MLLGPVPLLASDLTPLPGRRHWDDLPHNETHGASPLPRRVVLYGTGAMALTRANGRARGRPSRTERSKPVAVDGMSADARTVTA
jgi:hypothetical protein